MRTFYVNIDDGGWCFRNITRRNQLVLHICLRLTFLNFVYIKLHTGTSLELLYIYEWSFLAQVPSRENVWLILLWMKTASAVRQPATHPWFCGERTLVKQRVWCPLLAAGPHWPRAGRLNPRSPLSHALFFFLTGLCCVLRVCEERCSSGHFKLYTD